MSQKWTYFTIGVVGGVLGMYFWNGSRKASS